MILYLQLMDRFGISGAGGSTAGSPKDGSDGNHDRMGDSKQIRN